MGARSPRARPSPESLAKISSTADRREYRRRSCVHGTDAASAAECDSRARHDRGSRSPLASSVLRTFKVAGLGRARTTGTCNLAGGPRQDLVPESSGPPLNQPRQVHRRFEESPMRHSNGVSRIDPPLRNRHRMDYPIGNRIDFPAWRSSAKATVARLALRLRSVADGGPSPRSARPPSTTSVSGG